MGITYNLVETILTEVTERKMFGIIHGLNSHYKLSQAKILTNMIIYRFLNLTICKSISCYAFPFVIFVLTPTLYIHCTILYGYF